MPTKRHAHWVAVLGLLTLLAVLGLLLWRADRLPGYPSTARYPVRGVDVSAYQGEIDWPTLAGQNLRFAFIKATEGSGSVDDRFAENWAGALQSGLRVGAYHFFSFESPGATQADNFIATVPKTAGALPPVVDLELYGNWVDAPPGPDTVRTELAALLGRLEAQYGQKPILYASARFYALYLADGFADYELWIRSLLLEPALPDGRSWAFWQYSGRGRLAGYSGEEELIDLNVFYGSDAEFSQYRLEEAP